MGPKRKAAGAGKREGGATKKQKEEEIHETTHETVEEAAEKHNVQEESINQKDTQDTSGSAITLEDDGKSYTLRLLIPVSIYNRWRENNIEIAAAAVEAPVFGAVEAVVTISGSRPVIARSVDEIYKYIGNNRSLGILVADRAEYEINTAQDFDLSIAYLPLAMSSDRLVSVQGSNLSAALAFMLDHYCDKVSPVPYVPQGAVGQYGRPETFRRQKASIEALQALEVEQQRLRDAETENINGVGRNASGIDGNMANRGDRERERERDRDRDHGRDRDRDRGSGAGGGRHAPKRGVPLLSDNNDYKHAQSLVSDGASNQTLQFYIPPEAVGSIIGRGGQTINEMKNTSGAFIRFEDANTAAASHNKLLTITGTAESLRRALSLVYQKVESSIR